MQCYTDLKPPRIIITSWALDSYRELVPRHVNVEEYWSTLRPDIVRLRHRTTDARFNNPSFWGPAQSGPNKVISQAFKMKWHNIGPGRIQLRLGVVECEGDYYLCHAWSKTSQNQDFQSAMALRDFVRKIRSGAVLCLGTIP